jgi:opacity protein-like surface antigen
MKRYIEIILALLFVTAISQAQYTSRKTSYNYFTVTPSLGMTFPGKNLGNYSSGINAGMDVGYRMNKDLAIFGKLNYSSLPSNTAGIPDASYLELTAGPRYYISNLGTNSAFFIEGGVGAFSLSRTGTTGSTTNAGVTAGAGVTFGLSSNLSLIVKGNYNNVFTQNNPTTFGALNGGLQIRF